MGRAPHPDDARQALTDLAERRSEINRAEAAWRHDLGQAIAQAIAAGVPKSEIAELSGMSRATLYRHLEDQR